MTIPCYPCRDPRKNNNKPNQKCTRAAAFLPFFSTKPLVEVAAVSAQTLQLSAGVRNMPSHAHFPQPGLPLKGGKSPSSSCDPFKHQCQLSKGHSRHSCFASSHGHGFSNVLFVLLLLCIQDLLLRGNQAAKILLWKIMRTSAASAPKQTPTTGTGISKTLTAEQARAASPTAQRVLAPAAP